MKRSHPPTVLKLVERSGLLARGELVLCGVSGGPDSMCLLHALARLRNKRGHRVVAAGVDHGLRETAGAELDLAEVFCRAEKVDFHRLAVDVSPGSNLLARARTARHGALQQLAAELGADALALGHTGDDRAETVIMRILRGAGPRGLAAMPPRAPGIEGETLIIRPLLRARRSDVLAHLSRHGVAFAEDPSNLDRRFLRVRVRHEVIPLLEELSPEIVAHLCSLSDMLDGDDPLDGLGRAQRQDFERALKEGLRGKTTSITLRLQGDRELELRFGKGSERFRKRKS